MVFLWLKVGFLIMLVGWVFLAKGRAFFPSAVLTPIDKSVITGNGYIHVVIEVKPVEKSHIAVRLNRQEFLPLLTPRNRQGVSFHHYGLPLGFGENYLEIVHPEGLVENIRLFFYSELGDIGETGGHFTVPPPFQFRPFHEPQRSEKCRQCHEMTPKETDKAPPTPSQSTCFPCHRRITAFPQVHGSAAVWSCTVPCHNPTSAPALYATQKPVRDLCYTCHVAEGQQFFSSLYQHGPTATGKCTICHNPHGTENPFWLKKPPWYLCTTCHPEKSEGKHVLAWGITSDSHPTRGRKDLSRPGAELACNSCHNPHAANTPALWKFGAMDRMEFCQACHNK